MEERYPVVEAMEEVVKEVTRRIDELEDGIHSAAVKFDWNKLIPKQYQDAYEILVSHSPKSRQYLIMWREKAK